MFDVEVTDVVPELKNERKTNLELLDKRDARQMWEGEAKLRPCLGKIKQLTENVRLLMDAATLVRREEAEREGEGGGVEFTGNNS